MKTLIGIFIIAHGLIHSAYLAPKPSDPKYPFVLNKSWFADLVGPAAQPIGIVLAALTVALFILAGLAILGVPGLSAIWKQLAIGGSIVSLLLLLLFWHPWLVVGILIDVIAIYGILKLGWTIK